MIVEHEVIEQFEEDAKGWPLSQVCTLIRARDKEPFRVLRGMWRAQLVVFLDERGRELGPHRCEEVLRVEEESSVVRVAATDHGSASVYRRPTR